MGKTNFSHIKAVLPRSWSLSLSDGALFVFLFLALTYFFFRLVLNLTFSLCHRYKSSISQSLFVFFFPDDSIIHADSIGLGGWRN